MLKTSRKIFFSVVLISLLGSSSRCDAMFACLVVIAMKVAPYLIWTAPPVIVGGYQWYHNSLSVKMNRGFQEARQDRAQLRTEIKGGFDTACQERTRLQTSVDGNGLAISELAKQEKLNHGNTLTALQQTTDDLTLMQRETYIKLKERLMCAAKKHESITATLTDNSGQLSDLTKLQMLLQQQFTRMEAKIDRLLKPSQLAHHSFLQRRGFYSGPDSFLQRRRLLSWPSPRYALLPSATTAVPRRAQIDE